MSHHTLGRYRLLRVAAVFALSALVLMLAGLFESSPLLLVVAMSIGQGLGTLSFAIFGLVVFLDLRRARVFSRETSFSTQPPPPARSGPPKSPG